MTSSNEHNHVVDPYHKLLAGNRHWVKFMHETHPHFFPGPPSQTPHTLWIGCGDSRVPETTITEALPGEIFVNRNLGNQVRYDDESLMATLSYAVEELLTDFAQIVIVCGHTECGAVSASYRARETADAGRTPITIPHQRPDAPLNRFLAPLTSSIRNLVEWLGISSVPEREALPLLIRENVRAQVDNLSRTEVVQNAWKTRPIGQELLIHGWVYDIRTGFITELVTYGPDILREDGKLSGDATEVSTGI
ncbi:carbonic anhydrase [Lentinula raphanica]|nr:carbonic anhydrase [Lentinula raphanica]